MSEGKQWLCDPPCPQMNLTVKLFNRAKINAFFAKKKKRGQGRFPFDLLVATFSE